jgi:hypothetical protein
MMPLVVCLWSAARAVVGCEEVSISMPMSSTESFAHQEPVRGRGHGEPSSADDHPSFGHALDRVGKVSKQVANRSTTAGSSRTRKSVAAGSP